CVRSSTRMSDSGLHCSGEMGVVVTGGEAPALRIASRRRLWLDAGRGADYDDLLVERFAPDVKLDVRAALARCHTSHARTRSQRRTRKYRARILHVQFPARQPALAEDREQQAH